jgi:deazaflavin-dependent oxidoreductase (nitroreductase family)
MSANEWNRPVVDEFRANKGIVGGMFEGMPIVLVHNFGAKSGAERINPLAYQRLDDDSIAVFASAGGAPKHPDWFHNVVANPEVSVEIGTESFDGRARVASSEEREPIWEAQKKALPQFAEYEEKTRGVREIPVVIIDKA